MNNKELIYFKTIADEKSVSQAARKLYMSQPSLSQYLKRIEENLDIHLFTRTSSGLTLTYAGERYYMMATQVLKMYENFEMEISDINHLRAGRLNIGVTRHLGSCVLPRILPRFHAICPNVRLGISEVTSSLQEEQLLSGKLDFSLMHAPPVEDRNPAVNYELRRSTPFIVAVPAGSPLSQKATPASPSDLYPILDIQELRHEPFIMIRQGQRIRQFSNVILRNAGITHPQILCEVSNLDTVIRCVAAGLGNTLLPLEYSALSLIDNPPIYYTIPDKYKPTWNFCIATSKESYMTQAALLFIRMVKEIY